jgi:23S rRNA (guanosine2251-2'-O)-methyltransferase
LKNFRQQQHRPKKNSLIIGFEAVMAAMQNGEQLERIYLQSTRNHALVEPLKKLAAEYMVPINKVPIEKLNSFNISNHEGCVAQKAKVQYQDLQNVVSLVVENGQVPLLIILDGVTDIRNIGGIARSAVCFGAHAIVIPAKGVGSLNEDAILTSAGALEQIPVCRVTSLHQAVDELHLNGIKVFASEMKASTAIQAIDLTEPCAIIIGGEENGVHPSLLKICDAQFAIPMPGDFESLNVSVATGVMLYEVARQRGS